MRSRPIGNMNVDIGICEVTTGTCPLTSAWYCSNQISSFDNYNVPVTFSHFHVVNQKCPCLIVATKRSEAVYHYMNTNKTRYIYSHHYSYVLLKHFVNVSSQKKEIAYCYKVDGERHDHSDGRYNRISIYNCSCRTQCTCVCITRNL